MSEFLVKKLKRYFNVLDIDGDGVLTKMDFEMLGERFGENVKLNPARQEKLRKNLNNVWHNFSKFAGNEKNLLTELVFIESVKKQRNDEEFKANLIEMCQISLEAFDTNEDGFLQEDEHRRFFEAIGFANFASYAKIAFDAIDSNHDGRLSKDELTTAFLDFIFSEDDKSPFQLYFGPLE